MVGWLKCLHWIAGANIRPLDNIELREIGA
jgi:hypothetical protein